jgi:hypothetical protein
MISNDTSGHLQMLARIAAAFSASGTSVVVSGGAGAYVQFTVLSGNYTVVSETLILVAKTVGAATTITLPSSPAAGRTVTVKDGKGDANTHNITVVGSIDGGSSFLIVQPWSAITFVWTGSMWSVL